MKPLQATYHRLVSSGPKTAPERVVLLGLLAASGLFRGLVQLRLWLFARGLLGRYRAAVPVVSVGNLTVGGTGKTPLVDWLTRWALERGYRPAIVSRGYGGRRRDDPLVVSDGRTLLIPDPALVGDEPVLLARRNPRACVVVARRRRRGVRVAETIGADLIILDDGFQHLRVVRDLDVVLLDQRRPFGNGQLLPAGPLREPRENLARADLVVLTRSDGSASPEVGFAGPILTCRHLLSPRPLSLSGEEVDRTQLQQGRGLAFAGIADPQRFFAALQGDGYQLARTIALEDHQDYTAEVLADIAAACSGADFCLTTEKDAVKLQSACLPIPCYQVPLDIDLGPADQLEARLEGLIQQGAVSP